jgi:sugar lactone lactonase YvrE
MSLPKGVSNLVIFILIAVAAYVLLWPVSFEPQAWTPPEAPAMTGVYEPNTALSAVERIGSGVDFGPEDTAFDRQGRIYAGMEHGRIVRFQPDGGGYEGFAETGGRPLGMAFDRSGNLIVADARKGLLSVSPDSQVTVLATEAEGLPFGLTDDVDVASDGTVYFSDASWKHSIDQYVLDGLEHGTHGRLLAYDPASRETRVLLDELSFANGVAVSPDQSYVLVCETWRYRIQRYWLSGPRRGQSDVFVENLPGFPDGVSSNGEDTFWLALFAPRLSATDAILPHPFLRKVLLRLHLLNPDPQRFGWVLGLDADGNVTHNFQDPTGTHYAPVTSAEESNGALYLGSLDQDSIGRLPLR